MQKSDIFESLCDIRAMSIEFGSCPITFFNERIAREANFNCRIEIIYRKSTVTEGILH